MFVIPIFIEACITGFESPAAEYTELGISLDELIIKHPNANFIGLASGQSMQDVGIFDGKENKEDTHSNVCIFYILH